ncbi:MAG TPA: nucleoside deaminase [Ignavibacteriaceae bacterium]|nr:nucleoside deaminase [Ignavibacteriaceae bacterium]
MLFEPYHYATMSSALKLAETAYSMDEVPVGAVITYNKKIIGKGYNQIELLKDCTAHAEILAITAAEQYLQTKVLAGCELFVTLEPCIMCIGAAILAKLDSVYFAAFDTKSGACGSVYNIPGDQKLNHTIKIYSGLFEDEAKRLLSSFFSEKRKKKED